MMCGLLVPILLATPAWSAEIFRLEWIEEVPATDAAELYDRPRPAITANNVSA